MLIVSHSWIYLPYKAYLHAVCCTICLWGQSANAQPPHENKPYRQVFADEFDALDLGTDEKGSASQPHTWYEGVWFSRQHAPRERFSVSNSALSLKWKRGQTQPDSSVATFSRNRPEYHAWRYGYFEARMKWQPQTGAWPAFWLIPVEAALDRSVGETGEIDIFEGQGSEPLTFFGTIHRWLGTREMESSSPHNHFALPANTDFAVYHTYGLLWTSSRMTWYFDGVALHSERPFAIFDRQHYFLILGMQEGADWKSGDMTGVTAQNMTLTVDWVRVWQLHFN
jgi:Glycosyl hydrolases family 16